MLAEAYLATGAFDRAHAAALEGLRLTTETGYRHGMGWARRALGRIEAASGSREVAAPHLQAALELFTSIQAQIDVATTLEDMAAFGVARGRFRPGPDAPRAGAGSLAGAGRATVAQAERVPRHGVGYPSPRGSGRIPPLSDGLVPTLGSARLEIGLIELDLAYLGIADLGKQLQTGLLSPVELCRVLLDRCVRLEPRLNAFFTLDAERILAEARVAERELASRQVRGPLHGVPIAVKDLFRTRGERTTAGSPVLAEVLNRLTEDEDAVVVARLRKAGAIVFGKTNTPELAYGVTDHYPYGPSRNPWDLERFPGGSSMGSAVAVSAGLVPGALGTDTGGSIRAPAHWCGVTGLKATWGRVPLRGVVPQAISLDHAGPIARDARDVALLLAAIAGHDVEDPTSADVAVPDYVTGLEGALDGLTVGVPQELWRDLAPDVGRACETALQELTHLGLSIRTVRVSQWDEAVKASGILIRCEAATEYDRLLAERASDLVPEVRNWLQAGMATQAPEYIRARRTAQRFTSALTCLFREVDLLALPGYDRTALRMADSGMLLEPLSPRNYTAPFNVAGTPALTFPCGFDTAGLPIGLQLASRAWGESMLLRVGARYQASTAWHLHRPPLPP